MRKADLVNIITEKTGVPKVDVLVTLEMFFKEIKNSLSDGENVYVRGFGSFIIKKERKKLDDILRKINPLKFLNTLFLHLSRQKYL